VLEFVEEALDEVALAIEGKIAWQWNRAAGWEGMTGVIPLPARVSMKASAS
jgi:hypothetical protein